MWTQSPSMCRVKIVEGKSMQIFRFKVKNGGKKGRSFFFFFLPVVYIYTYEESEGPLTSSIRFHLLLFLLSTFFHLQILLQCRRKFQTLLLKIFIFVFTLALFRILEIYNHQ